jgi:hypothetical protein
MRRILLAKEAEIGKKLEEIQQPQVIGESNSPWSSPAVLARGENGDLTF